MSGSQAPPPKWAVWFKKGFIPLTLIAWAVYLFYFDPLIDGAIAELPMFQRLFWSSLSFVVFLSYISLHHFIIKHYWPDTKKRVEKLVLQRTVSAPAQVDLAKSFPIGSGARFTHEGMQQRNGQLITWPHIASFELQRFYEDDNYFPCDWDLTLRDVRGKHIFNHRYRDWSADAYIRTLAVARAAMGVEEASEAPQTAKLSH